MQTLTPIPRLVEDLSISRSLKDAVRLYERSVILEALKLCAGDKRKAARLLGIGLASLYRKISDLPVQETQTRVQQQVRKEGQQTQ